MIEVDTEQHGIGTMVVEADRPPSATQDEKAKLKPMGSQVMSIADLTDELPGLAQSELQEGPTECFLHPEGPFTPVRRIAAKVVQNPYFEWFILFLIFITTISMCIYQYTDPECDLNWYIDRVMDPILLSIFTIECLLKITAWGLIWPTKTDHVSYLRDFPWNWLDLLVVVTGWMTIDPENDGGFAVLRIFRVLRPLRSMTMLPELRKYVITVLNSIRGLIDVMLMAIFIFTVFAIIGVTLWGGIFYRRCRKTQNPVLSASGQCWEWEIADPDDPRLCGGRYNCPSGIRCGGHIDDAEEYQPVFPGGDTLGLPWCEGYRDINLPKKTMPETDFIHFDHIGGALLIIFQSMTMEGWVDIMYLVQDGAGLYGATFFFLAVILVTSFFVLNMILAVISETYEEIEDLDQEKEANKGKDGSESEALSPKSPKSTESQTTEMKREDLKLQTKDLNAEIKNESIKTPNVEAALAYLGNTEPKAKVEPSTPEAQQHHDHHEEYWMNCAIVRFCFHLQEHEVFRATVLFFIVANVVVMLLEKWPPDLHLREFQFASNIVFSVVFGVEMVVMLTGLGPKKYWTTFMTAFDGIIVIGNYVEFFVSGEGGSPLTVLRIFRLARVVVKMSSGVPAFGLLLRSMVRTVKSLGYFGLLFLLVLLICTLIGLQIFATRFHFSADWDEVLDDGSENDPIRVFCVGPGYGKTEEDKNKDCIPRANFDTFIEGFTTIFQIMSGENWNTVMYDAMRARGWFYGAFFFVVLILFGQTLMLNLFLTILMARFADAEESLKKEEEEKKAAKKVKKRGSFSLKGGGFYSETKRRLQNARMGRSDTDNYVTLAEDEIRRVQSAPETKTPKYAIEMSGEKSEPAWLPGQTHDANAVVHYSDEVTNPAERTRADDGQEAQDVPLMDMRDVGLRKVTSDPPAIQDGASYRTATTSSALSTTTSRREPKVYPDQWPYSYALLLFHRDNVIRRMCFQIVSNQYFDHFILVCIVISSICMALATPLDDPDATLTILLNHLDTIFSVIFIIEMLMKLVCFGLLLWSPKSYLLNGWNILDGVVVIVSIIDLFSSSSTGFLKTLRILRAFRPLRVIARNQALQVAVTTLFKSLPELVTLVLALMIFLLIIAIVLLQYLNGRFYDCFIDGEPVKLGGDDIGPALAGQFDSWRTPLCVGPLNESVGAAGSWDGENKRWNSGSCSDGFVHWERPSMDTPICVGRCSAGSKLKVHGTPPEAVCPKELSRIQELPSVCPDGELRLEPASDSPYYADELIGSRYVKAQLANWILPCGTPRNLSGIAVTGTPGTSCRELFCPERGSSDYCKNTACKDHPEFCHDTCKSEPNSERCSRCIEQCEAWCECEDYCEPLSREAAICVEQGGTWGPVLSQNFNTIANAMLTLFELTTTEGWVDVMYAAVDSRASPFDQTPFYMTPKRGSQVELWCLVFCLYIFFSNMFIINLSVGVIVENFINIKRETGSVALTKAQEKWVISQKSLYGRACLFQLTNLHHKPKWQRRTFIFISSPAFENFIMGAIVLNTLLMAANAFPLPVDWWDTFLSVCNYIFALLFCLEFLVKLYALRINYWKDSWNLFDFICVFAALGGFIAKVVFKANIGSVMSVIRIFRVARLFRLLRFMKGVNKIFMALVFSAPKLLNVIFLLMLLMGMYSILGVQLFATQKFSETMNHYGNFRSIFSAFTTLFRSMTGEAWNEIMHDLTKGQYEFARGGEWCSPKNLFLPDTEQKDAFNILKDKCLIEYPNRCGAEYWPQMYFVSFTIIITFTVLNLVIAVILDGYEDGKEHTEAEVIDTCIRVWKKYDHNFTMFLSFMDAFTYVDEVLRLFPDVHNPHEVASPQLRPSDSGVFGMDLTCVPMRYANDFDLVMTEDGNVHFIHVVKLVLQVVVSQNNPTLKHELKAAVDKMSDKEKNKLLYMETRQMHKNRALLGHSVSLRAQVAASKIQKRFKARLRQCRHRQQQTADQISAESFSEPNPPETGNELGPNGVIHEEHLEPRSPANVDGLDEPGRTKLVSVNPPSDRDASQEDWVACTSAGQAPGTAVSLHHPPPGG